VRLKYHDSNALVSTQLVNIFIDIIQ